MKNFWVFLLLTLFAVLLFANSVHNGFVNYDDWWLVHHERMHGWLTPHGLWQLFFNFSKEVRMEHGAEYLPVRDLSAAVQYHFFGEDPFPYHLVQVSLFTLSVLFLVKFFLALGASPTVALLSGGLMIAHPIHVESVTWLSGHKDILSLLFFSICLWSYARKKFVLCFFAFVLGLASKYYILFTPLLFPFVDQCRGRRFYFRRSLPFLLLAIGSYALSSRVAETVHYAHIDLGNSFSVFLKNVPVVFDSAIHRLLLPIHLQVFYPYDPPCCWNDLRVVGGVVELGLIAVLIFIGWKKFPTVSFGAFLLIAGLAPMFRAPEMHFLADRYFLFSSIGFLFLVSHGLEWMKSPFFRFISAGIVLIFFSFLTFHQNQVWRSSEALWENALKGQRPVHRMVWENMAVVMRDSGQWQRAAGYYRYLIDSAPAKETKMVSNLVDLGFCEINLGEFQKAEKDLKHAIELDPHSAKGYLNLGVALANQNKKNGAKESFEKARILDPTNPEPIFNLARLAVEERNFRELKKWIEVLRKLAPNDVRIKILETIK